MGKANRVVQTFTNQANWTCPAGITNINVTAFRAPYVDVPQSGSSGSTLIRNAGPTFVLDSFRNAWAWGPNASGQLGWGTFGSAQNQPLGVVGGLSFMDIATAGTNTLALSTTGSIYGWGQNANGELGQNNVTAYSSPVAVQGGGKFVKIRMAPTSSFGLTATGAAYGWGQNLFGVLGIGNTTSQSAPIAVLGGFSFVDLFMTNGTSIFGLTSAGALYGWGVNGNGQLGIGSVLAKSSPIAVLGGITFSSIQGVNIGGSVSVFGLSSNGTLYAWGANGSGILGLGDSLSRSSPVAVLGGLRFTQFTASGMGSIVALTANGTAYAWGANGYGQLGVGDTVPRSSPVAVLGGNSFVNVFADLSGSFFGTKFNTSTGWSTLAWGNNQFGELGIGSVAAQSSPVAVLGGFDFIQIVGDTQGTIAGITNSGLVYGWGLNGSTYSNIGLGDFLPRSSPVAVLSNFAAADLTNQSLSSVRIAVTPGVTYPVTFNQVYAYFNHNRIGGGPVNTLSIEYFS